MVDPSGTTMSGDRFKVPRPTPASPSAPTSRVNWWRRPALPVCGFGSTRREVLNERAASVDDYVADAAHSDRDVPCGIWVEMSCQAGEFDVLRPVGLHEMHPAECDRCYSDGCPNGEDEIDPVESYVHRFERKEAF
jgi:hypothetical protein